jgi:hypothetical protein
VTNIVKVATCCERRRSAIPRVYLQARYNSWRASAEPSRV